MNLTDVRKRGLWIHLIHADRNLYVGPQDRVTPEIESQIAAHKKSLIAELQKEVGQGQVGSELIKIIPEIFKYGSCGCEEYARKMDGWGIEGCQVKFAEIVDYLVEQAVRLLKLKRIVEFTGRPVAERWLTQAIENASQGRIMNTVSTASDGQLKSVVWVYWHGGAEGEELRYSMRAAMKFLADASDPLVCGDKPEWFSGGFIESRRRTKAEIRQEYGSGRFAKWLDSTRKLQAIVNDPRVTDDFLWMYDDTFLLKPMSIEWIGEPKALGDLHDGELDRTARRTWREVRRRTKKALTCRNLPSRDYSHHFPIVYNKEKLQQTIDEFNVHGTARVIESLYMNHHYKDPSALGAYFQYAKKISPVWSVRPEAAVLNVGGFRPRVQKLMQRVCPERSRWEKSA